MPTKAQLLDGINLACNFFLRSAGPDLVPNPSTGAIEEDWTTVVPAQSLGDAPIVCVAVMAATACGDAAKKGELYMPDDVPLAAVMYLWFGFDLETGESIRTGTGIPIRHGCLR